MRNANPADGLLVVLTVPRRALATKLGNLLLKERLIASIQIQGAITSHYRWQGRLEKKKEWTVSLRTRAACFDALVEVVRAHHPYVVPEILALPIESYPEYLAWIRECCSVKKGNRS